MPRRRNLFQDVVAIMHRHMAGEAEVDEGDWLADTLLQETHGRLARAEP